MSTVSKRMSSCNVFSRFSSAAVLGVSRGNGDRPVADFLFRDEARDQAAAANSGIDAAVAAKGHKPSSGSAFYAGLWYQTKWGLTLLENILKGPGTSSQKDGKYRLCVEETL